MNRRALISLLGAYAVSASAQQYGPELSTKELSLFTPISGAVSRARNCLLYEGLPSPVSDADQFSHELVTKETLQFHGYPFYKRRLSITADDVQSLRKRSAFQDTYWGDRGPKHCLPFHPDYCLMWLDDKAAYEQMICFGCQEMRFYGPDRTLFLDIRTDAARQLAQTLKNYRAERPRPIHGWNY